MVNLDHFARMDVLGDKYSVEDGEERVRGGPSSAIKARLTTGEQ